MRTRLEELLRFAIVGGIAFCVDAAMLELFVAAGLAAPIARLFSIACATQIAYLLHGGFTYRNHAGYSRASWLKFMGSNAVGATINYGIFLAVLFLRFSEDARLARLAALAIATAVSMCFNYWANRRFAFKVPS